jgi:hypothetical protein
MNSTYPCIGNGGVSRALSFRAPYHGTGEQNEAGWGAGQAKGRS